jgi:hypothetical protein
MLKLVNRISGAFRNQLAGSYVAAHKMSSNYFAVHHDGFGSEGWFWSSGAAHEG